jgi:hypothetical protein
MQCFLCLSALKIKDFISFSFSDLCYGHFFAEVDVLDGVE